MLVVARLWSFPAWLIALRLLAMLIVAGPAPSIASAQSPVIDDDGPRASLSAKWERPQAVAGETIGLAAVIDVQPGWHINPGLETGQASEFQIPSRLEIDPPDGWSAGSIQWPAAHELDLPALGGVVPIYEGRIVAYAPVTIPAEAEPGTYSVDLTLHYQACDDSVCEMPASVTTTAELEVISAAVTDSPDSPESSEEPSAETTELFAKYAAPANGGDATAPKAQSAPVETDHLTLDLLWERDAAIPGDVLGLALIVETKDQWHLYPGAGTPEEHPSFIPTTVDLDLPPGWTAGIIDWPEADTIIFGAGPAAQEIDVYHGRFVIRVPIAVAPESRATPGENGVIVTFGYMACDDEICDMPVKLAVSKSLDILDPSAAIPAPSAEAMEVFRGFTPDFTGVELPTGDTTTNESEAEAKHEHNRFTLENLRWWGALLFVTLAMGWMMIRTLAITTRFAWRAAITITGVAVTVGWLAFTLAMTAPAAVNWRAYSHDAASEALARDQIVVIDFTADWCINCKVVERTVLNDSSVARLLNSDQVAAFVADVTTGAGEAQERLDELGRGGIPLLAIIHPGAAEEPILLRGIYTQESVIAAIQGDGEPVTGDGFVFDFLGRRFRVGESAWPIVLVLAAIAGFFLNLTPCVLPVIPIKILSLQAHAKDPKRCLALGLVFGLGITAMFAILGGLAVLLPRLVSGATGFDWGALWQFWWFAGLMGLIVLIMGFGMLGLFDFKLPDFVYMFSPSSESTGGSFAMGVFTAVLSTPCTGPLLGATVAWVALQPTWLGLTTFVIMGVGMALPYVLLTARPSWLERVPRSGPGSVLVKQVMGLMLLGVAMFFIGISASSLA